MKKVLLLSLTCLSAASMARAQSAESVMAFAQKVLLPEESVFANDEKPTISPTAGGYEIRVPAFEDMGNEVPAYTLNLDKVDGKADVYRVLISNVDQYKNLGSLLKSLDVTTSSFEYDADLDVSKDIVSRQSFSMNDIFKAFDEQKTEYGRVKSVSVKTDASLSDDGSFWNKAHAVVLAPEIVSSLFNFKAQDLTVYTEGEILKFPFDDTDDITNLGDLKMSLKLNGASADSFLSPVSVLNVDAALDADMNENEVTKEATLNVKVHLDNIRIKTDVEKLAKYIPTTADSKLTATGFTYAELNDLSKAQRALVQLSDQDVPDAARADLESALMANLQSKKDAFTDNLKIELSNVVSSADYDVDFSGNLDAKTESLVGTLAITNFDYLAPEPKVVSPERCDAAKKKLTEIYMSNNGKISDSAVSKALTDVQNACDEGRGPLDALREYLPTAQKSKNAKGQDVVTFDLKIQKDTLYINGKPVNSFED